MRVRVAPNGTTADAESDLSTTTMTDEVVEAARVDGVWLPMEVFGTVSDTSRPRLKHSQTWVVLDVSLAEPPAKVFDVEFPVGSTVIDKVHQVAYDIVDDGVVRPSDFALSGNVATSPPDLVRKSLEVFPPYEGFVLKTLLPAEQPAQAVAAATPAATDGGLGDVLWLGLLIGGGAVVLVLFVIAVRGSARFSGGKGAA